MKEEELQTNEYYNKIEEDDEFDIEEEEEEIITLDFEKGLAISQGIVVGEDLLNRVSERLNEQSSLPESIKAEQTTVIYKAPEPTYRDTLSNMFIDSLTSKAIASLIKKHNDLETDVYDSISKKHCGMGDIYSVHEEAMLKSIDEKKKELKKCYGFSGRVSHEHIPEWAKPYVEDYIKNFIYEITSLMGDI